MHSKGTQKIENKKVRRDLSAPHFLSDKPSQNLRRLP